MAFTSDGFNHLIRKGRIPRTKNEQKRRFILVQHIEEIIKNPKAEITFRQTEEKYTVNRHGEKVKIISVANFWTFHANIDKCEIKLVIRQIGQGQKQFQSIMSNLKTRKQRTKKPS